MAESVTVEQLSDPPHLHLPNSEVWRPHWVDQSIFFVLSLQTLVLAFPSSGWMCHLFLQGFLILHWVSHPYEPSKNSSSPESQMNLKEKMVTHLAINLKHLLAVPTAYLPVYSLWGVCLPRQQFPGGNLPVSSVDWSCSWTSLFPGNKLRWSYRHERFIGELHQ